jgi:hypothetical protein
VALLLFTLALAAGLMAGHPETYFYGSLLLGAWLAYRCAGHPEGARTGLVRFGQLAACGLAAIALCAIQLLPFFEYLGGGDASEGLAGLPPQPGRPASATSAATVVFMVGSRRCEKRSCCIGRFRRSA